MNKPIVLTIAGSDSIGGAGIQADITTINDIGCHAATVVTAVAAQNSLGVHAVYSIPSNIIKAQIESVMNEYQPSAIKIGMVYSSDTVRCIFETLSQYSIPPIVYDPVMVASSGGSLMSSDTLETITQYIFPISTLITPNIPEASKLLNIPIITSDTICDAAQQLVKRYKCNILLKGGHLSEDVLTDVLATKNKEDVDIIKTQRIKGDNFHGTGCRLSSGIAGYIAQGYSILDSIKMSKESLERYYINTFGYKK